MQGLWNSPRRSIEVVVLLLALLVVRLWFLGVGVVAGVILRRGLLAFRGFRGFHVVPLVAGLLLGGGLGGAFVLLLGLAAGRVALDALDVDPLVVRAHIAGVRLDAPRLLIQE